MKKKRSAKATSNKKRTSTSSKPQKDLTEIQGLFVLSAAIALILSLLSFSYGPEGSNWIGLIGFTTGKILHATFGLGSYFICLYMAWIGWRLLFTKPISHPWIKGLYLFVFVASLCIILSLIEDRLPSVARALGNTFYANLWQRRLHYHLGGALFYYLYHDLPLFNLRSILNTTGVAILFSCTSIASLLFFAKRTPAQMLAAVITFLQNVKAKFSMPPREESEEGDYSDVVMTPEEENQMRFVKLRIPEGPQPAQPTASSKSAPPGNSQEMLGIQPETKLTVRPSISQKTMSESGRPPILSSHFKKERKETPAELPLPATLPAPITPPSENKPAASPPAQKKTTKCSSSTTSLQWRFHSLYHPISITTD